MSDIIGFIGAALLTFSAIPQLIKTIKTKKVNDLSIHMLLCWSMGCFSMFVYIILTSRDLPLLINYFLNTSVSSTICFLYFLYKK